MIDILEKLLQDRNLSYYRLSKMTGIPTSSFTVLKQGKVKYLSFENMEKIAEALDVSLDVFRIKDFNNCSGITKENKNKL